MRLPRGLDNFVSLYEFYILVKYFMSAVLDYCNALREITVCTKAKFSNVSSVPLFFLKGHYKRI